MSEDFSLLIPDVQHLVRETGLFIKEELGKVHASDIETKALNSLVSYVDKTAEEKLVAGLNKILPNAGYITEEDTPDDRSKDQIWIIDPLDGTTNFLRQIPYFSVSLALQVSGTLELGLVYNIMLDEMFSAARGKGAFLNGNKIQVSNTSSLKECIIATGFPYEKRESFGILTVLEAMLKNVRGLRRFGSAALDLAYVACGRVDAYYECCVNTWDVAAGIILVQEAGGNLSDFSGGESYIEGHEIIASNPHIQEKILALISQNK